MKYEDLRIALLYLNKNDWMVKFDIHSAYHHIDIYEPHTTYLGFSSSYPNGSMLFMKLVVLPFGLCSAPYLYSKITKPLVAKWRAESKRTVLYLDDGFDCHSSKETTDIMAKSMKSDIIRSGVVSKADNYIVFLYSLSNG